MWQIRIYLCAVFFLAHNLCITRLRKTLLAGKLVFFARKGVFQTFFFQGRRYVPRPFFIDRMQSFQ